jgi:nitrogen fixation protein NifB
MYLTAKKPEGDDPFGLLSFLKRRRRYLRCGMETNMATTCKQKNIQGHPCFGGNHQKNGRMHLAVAPRCNIKCRYCTRRHDCANESRPGVTSRLITPQEAILKVRDAMNSEILGPIIKVIGIAGPGDPLANEQTFETFRLIGEEFPHLIKCMSTNGLLLPEKINLLNEIDLCSLTVTLNALDPAVGAEIYSHILFQDRVYRGTEAAKILVENQLEGIARAVECGMTVKVNTVYIPGINEQEITPVAHMMKKLGVSVMNVMPLIPQADFAHIAAPSEEKLEELRRNNEKIIGQFKHCRQCRADAAGLIGQDFLQAKVC